MGACKEERRPRRKILRRAAGPRFDIFAARKRAAGQSSGQVGAICNGVRAVLAEMLFKKKKGPRQSLFFNLAGPEKERDDHGYRDHFISRIGDT